MKKILLILFLSAAFAGSAFLYLKESQPFDDEAENLAEKSDFSKDILLKKAQNLSYESYNPSVQELPDELTGLDYDGFRDIRFNRENGPWFGKNLPFEIQTFHLGFLFNTPVSINEITGQKSSLLKYSSKFFDYGKNSFHQFPDNLGYAGFRLHYPLNSSKYYDELVSFLGASYFRALGKGHKYGLSARGLAIDTALQTGEEFPVFKEFWVERPTAGAKTITVYALLDSKSVSGAYVFKITPGSATKMEVDATLFPRKDIKKIGIAPLTSMFLFGENNHYGFDDYRPEVHDSDGLLLWNGNNEWIWRPLDNSQHLRISSFVDDNPKGFGLMQRDKYPEHYLDFEANYEQRPSAWVKPRGLWGEGMVQLVEIPSNSEIHDNIVAFWVPKEPILAGKEYHFAYDLYWTNEVPEKRNLAVVSSTYFGIGGVSGKNEGSKRKFVIDFSGNGLKKLFDSKKLNVEVSASEGYITDSNMIYNPLTKGVTLYLDFKPNDQTSELRARLINNGEAASEVWSYQWIP